MTIEKYENYLNVLGLECGASLKDIKSAYKKMVMKYHPDRQTDPIAKDLANEKLKKVNEAREFILDNYKYYGKSTTSKSSTSKSNDYSSEFSSNAQTNVNIEENNDEDEYEYDVDIYSTNSNLFDDKWKQNLPKSKLNEDLIKVLIFTICFAFIFYVYDYTPSKNVNETTNNSQPEQTETVSQKEVEYVKEIEEEPEKVEVKRVQQKPLTEEERIAKFEKEMTKTFDDYINAYGRYYDYPQLKDRTFTVDISSYLNNSLYSCKYISGDFEQQYEASKLYFDFESLMRGLPIYFRDDAKTNYEMRYKMQVTHTPQGTTVKLLDVWHYLEGDYR